DVACRQDDRGWGEGSLSIICGQTTEGHRAGVTVESLQQLECPGAPRVVLVHLDKRPRTNDVDAGLAVAKAIHSAEPLRHAVERGEVADEVIRGDVHTAFPGRSADEVDGIRVPLLALPLIDWPEPPKYGILGRQTVPLVAAQGAGQALDLAPGQLG